ncbi:hypothetical protein C7212DRAFT_348478 [Tuber magnatum]|uniref:Uncharacterized protein n=1 Tax=Tuber magnatum TaxID=42249 RepID=A0A317SBU2_9PEZI|nr:hypothetical protein C7212DRAFT_348478 [Tuber magnatum]
MSSRKRKVFDDKDDNLQTGDNQSTSVPCDGPASRLRNRPSLRRAELATSLKEAGGVPPPELAGEQNFEVVVWKRTPMQAPVDIRRKPKNAYIRTMLHRWPVAEAREAREEEIALHIRGLHTGEDASAWEKEVISKMKWLNSRLRDACLAFVQKVPSASQQPYLKEKSADPSPHDSSCHFPTCGRVFQAGQYRISFERSERSGNSSKSRSSTDLTHMDNGGAENNNPVPVDNEKCTFFCLECFDKLLMPHYTQGKVGARPTDPFSHKLEKSGIFDPPKPGYLRPSPSCRIYDRIQPETRSGANKPFVLSPKEREAIKTWKAYNYNQGLSKLSRRNGFMFTTGLASEQVKCNASGLDGIGIAEFMAVRFPENSAPTAE